MTPEGRGAPNKLGNILDRLLRLFTDIRAGEGLTAVLLASNVFLILGSYWMIKPTRGAIVTAEWGPEMATYVQVANVAVLALLAPMYGRLAHRLPRRRLISLVTWIIADCSSRSPSPAWLASGLTYRSSFSAAVSTG